jgi:hypothetical protein
VYVYNTFHIGKNLEAVENFIRYRTIILKLMLKKRDGRCGLDLLRTGNYCERCNEPLVPQNVGEFLDWPRTY